jgi:hypothetical protein
MHSSRPRRLATVTSSMMYSISLLTERPNSQHRQVLGLGAANHLMAARLSSSCAAWGGRAPSTLCPTPWPPPSCARPNAELKRRLPLRLVFPLLRSYYSRNVNVGSIPTAFSVAALHVAIVAGCADSRAAQTSPKTATTIRAAASGDISALARDSSTEDEPNAHSGALVGGNTSGSARASSPAMPSPEPVTKGFQPRPLDSTNQALPEIKCTTDPVELESARARPPGAIAAAVSDEVLQTWNVGGRSDSGYVSSRSSFHPATRVRIDAIPRLSVRALRSKAGRSLAHGVTASLRSHGYWPFRICFESGARERADPGGKTELRLTIASNGSVLRSRLLKTELRHHDIAICHTIAARHLRLDVPFKQKFDVDVTVAVWPGDVPLLPIPPSPPAGSTKTLRGMGESVAQHEPDILRCLQIARRQDPTLWGRLALSFELDETGHPTEIRESDSHFGDKAALACVAEKLQALVLPSVQPNSARFTAAWRLHRPLTAEPPPSGDAASEDSGTSSGAPEVASP